MAKKSLEQVIAENRELGFDPEIIQIAYANVNGDSEKVIEEIFRLQQQSTKFPTKPSNPHDEDAQLSKAIQMSMNEAKDKKISLEPLNPEQRVRKLGVPVGLKNIGNTCYFNSLLQTYFQNVNFVRSVLHYQIPEKYKPKNDADQKKLCQEDGEFKRKQASCKLVDNLKDLFGSLIASDKKYADPTEVISSVVDDYGNELTVGDQKDIGQFNLVFLSRIDEGLQLARKQSRMDIEDQNQNKEKVEDSPSKIKVYGDEKLEELSLLNRSSIKIQQNSIIKQEFIGKMSNFYSNEKQNIHKQEDELFSLLFINVNNRQLYKALQQITIQHIDDYRNEKGQVIGVEKQSWIKQAPKTLFFQIDRVVFNKQKSILQKINDQFDFPSIFYIDPFLSKNKQKALQIQKTVRKLRKEKDQYKDALKKMEKYGQKGVNLLDIFNEAANFLQEQNSFMETEKQIQNPLLFSNLKKQIKKDHINLLHSFRDNIKQRMNDYQKKVEEIDKSIEKMYASIRSTPYHLYSILIHEGSADSGHYYSYTFDIQSKTWKKYNDINITQEIEHQVMKQARGINYTSAYYIVYAQQQVLLPHGVKQTLRNYSLSSEENYCKDYFSTLVPIELINKVKQENSHLYLEIEQHKMGALANRVVDNYTKKFETCNEVHRKTKSEKKKNSTPPLLTNLPIYLKDNVTEDLYRNCLIENCINEYGPKEYSVVFEDLVKKKIGVFNDFKKPKKLAIDQKFSHEFIHNVYRASAARKLFQILNNQQYNSIKGLMEELKGGPKGEYFDWVSNVVCKFLIIKLLLDAESCLQIPEKCLQKLQLLIAIMFNFIRFDEERPLFNNVVSWMMDISIEVPKQIKGKVEELISNLNEKKYLKEYDHFLSSQNDPMAEIKHSTDIADAMWNLSRTENTLIEKINEAKEQVKPKMKMAQDFYSQMKKENLSLTKEQRRAIKEKKSD